MINESQSDSESTTQIAKAPNSIEQVHESASGKIMIICIHQTHILIHNIRQIIWQIKFEGKLNQIWGQVQVFEGKPN